ncbi:hypothetical protein CFBP498_33560 [Xanthomonas hortorum pv. vitians]|uniref:Uncharacterized protein n=1 Tax=Xanthomonas hortorum pv. vitians TaxID=83224 RepID=A0A6V7EAZ8_9XANT|nr:hypothetical protein BJD10_15565 [Xanthomonas hortorum pv. gardneri]ASW45002.1 hypothetical protein XJ27_02700 [Xanthomonas hortorum]PPU35509.1 hypothetical protein XcyCFBP4188_21330 [Xanthomonas hortorum pv. cynarae]CAD0348322.1 hypothetical protein CFBP498_33560 [Xanthomonas hortorum pv. vitians]APP85044.1 hypothetical protein BI317_13575 [Xanthomonas hortorum pv. gardneri]
MRSYGIFLVGTFALDATHKPYRQKHKRLHKGGVLGSGLAGDGALAGIDAGWRALAGCASVARPRKR